MDLGIPGPVVSRIGLVALSVLPACVGYTPQPLEPREELLLLALRAGTNDVGDDQPRPWNASWFPLEAEVRIDDGLTLGEANALALFYSPAVRAARADAGVAGAQVLQAGVLSNPQLFLGPRMSVRDSQVIFPAGITWDLPLWGERDAQRDLADARLTEKSVDVVDVELTILRHVRAAFLRLGRLQREDVVLEALSTASRQTVDWVEGLRRAGEVDSVALYLARTERDEASAQLETARAEAIRVRRELFALLGLLPDAPVALVVDESAASLPALPDPDDAALLRTPTLRAAESVYAATEAALRLEIARQYPGIQFGPQFEDDRGDPTIGFGLGVTLPLFDRNKGGIAAAQASRQRAREHYVSTLLQAAHAEARARDDLGATVRLLQIHRQGAMQDADEAARSLELRLRAGRADVVEVLAAQRAIARARARLMELEEQAAVASLAAAVAGGLALQQPASTNEEEKAR